MLTELNIKNFAIIDHLRLAFGPGFNVLTGETGAGKSILVDALNLLLGSRASPEMIRTGQEEASVEAFFELAEPVPAENLSGWPSNPEDGMLIKRLIHRSGKSRAFLNGNSITLHMLEELGEELINIYGQHEHQHFLHPPRHIDILDRSGGLLSLRQQYQEVFSRWMKNASNLEELISKEKQRSERLDFLTYQSQEILKASLKPPKAGKPNEEEELIAERTRLVHAEKLYAITHQGVEAIYGESGSVAERLKSTLQRLREGTRMDASLNPLASSIESILFQAEDAASSLRAYREKIHFDPRRLEIIESRLDEITKLKKKYGPTLEEVLVSKERIDRERENLESLGQQISELQENAADLHLKALSQAQLLSAKRKKVADELGVKVEAELTSLGMKKVRFQIEVKEDPPGRREQEGDLYPPLNQNGMNQVQFLISPNPGEDLKSLAKIASGGELSRIMLALKRIFAEGTRVHTLVFDEVDAGIGGGIAEVVGRKLKEISRQHQVFCITHLAPIASFADAHYKVSKKIQGGKTAVEVNCLRGEDQEQEIARMLGGVKITEKTIAHAREMLKNSSKRG
jgi:DNA repair protein RecN (Recombination protein N)